MVITGEQWEIEGWNEKFCRTLWKNGSLALVALFFFFGGLYFLARALPMGFCLGGARSDIEKKRERVPFCFRFRASHQPQGAPRYNQESL